MKPILFYLFTLVVLIFTGCEKDESTPELPDAAGAVTMTVQNDGSVKLSIKPVANAKTYHWYLNNDIVQNTSDTTYLANVSGIYKVAGVNSNSKEGAASTPVNVIVGLPGSAGDISKETQSNGYVLLSINEIPRATTYRWYKGDKEVQNTDSRTFLATESGSYRVAGVNTEGEGASSKPLLIEFDVFNILTKEHIPSETFRNWIKENIAGGSDEYTNYQAETYTGAIDLKELQVESLKGIEFFTSLDKLNCPLSLLTELDVSKNINLTYLDCSSNSLTALDISQLTKLNTLIITSNSIKSLDFSGCKESLMSLTWANNKLTVAEFAATNIKNLSNLRILDLHYNQFSDGILDLSGMSTVQTFELTMCKLTGVNISGCSNLKRLIIGTNNLTSLDLSGCPILEELYCQSNKSLATLAIDHLTATLKVINFNTCNISYKDFSAFTMLERVECYANPWQGALDFSKCTELVRLRCEDMGISTLNVSTCTKLQELYTFNNNLTELNLSGFTDLTLLQAFSNKLTSLNVSGCTSLKTMDIYENQLSSLDLSSCSSLDALDASNNLFPSLNISSCTSLSFLWVDNNQLTSINVSNNKSLTSFRCSNNNLGPQLDISNNNALTTFQCTSNVNLTQIKVWNTFSIVNPPSYFEKPSTAAWVYEFTK